MFKNRTKAVINSDRPLVLCGRALLSASTGGHYTAYCHNGLNNLWYEFDDQSVTEVPESCVQNAEAYVLFYK